MKKFLEIAEELKLTTFKLAKLRDQKLTKDEDWLVHDGKQYFTEAGCEKLRLAVAVPLAVPRKAIVKVLHRAPNSHWVYGKLPNDYRKVPVAVRPSWCDRLVGKNITVDIIEDANGGITYRHEALGK